MTAQTGGRKLSVEADIALVVNGQRATLTGSGSTLRLESQAPARLWNEVSRAALPSGVGSVNGPRAVGRIADLLADQGLAVDVIGPAGSVVRIGSGAPSRLGRLTTGSAAVQLGSVRAVAPTLASVAGSLAGSFFTSARSAVTTRVSALLHRRRR